MEVSLLSTIVAGGVILPPDLIPDDHPVVYDEDGNPLRESLNHANPNPDEELVADVRNAERYIALAVGYYNQMNGTDYVLCSSKKPQCGISTICVEEEDTLLFHCGFHAAPISDLAAAKAFYCDFDPDTDKFVRCCMLDGVHKCERCGDSLYEEEDYMKWDNGWGSNTSSGSDKVLTTDTSSGSDKVPSVIFSAEEKSRKSGMLYGSSTISGSYKVPIIVFMTEEESWKSGMLYGSSSSGTDKVARIIFMTEEEYRKADMLYGSGSRIEYDKFINGLPLNDCRNPGVPPPSSYSGDLAAGVSLSDKAKLRLKMVLPALTYYNKKQHTNYKLVDVLPYCLSIGNPCDVAHCNFIARQGDGPNKLFFVALELHKSLWVVVSCLVVCGKTTAGCHQCPVSERARTVIHPTCGFQHGLFPPLNEY